MEFKWKKYGDYAIKTDKGYSIARFKALDVTKYGLFELPHKILGYFLTPQEAKNEAIKHYNTKLALDYKGNNKLEFDFGMGSGYKKEKK
jgi:hypothetical protein